MIFGLAKKNKILDCKIDEFLYYLALGTWLFVMILGYLTMFAVSLQGVPIKTVRLACLCLLVLSEVLAGRYNFISIFFLLAVFLADTILIENISGVVVDSLLFIYCGRNFSFLKAAKTGFVVIAITTFFVIGASRLGLIQDYVEVTQLRTRHYLGFLYSLHPSMLVFILTCLWIYFRREKLSFIEGGIFLIFNYLVYLQTVSRLSFYLSFVVVLLAFLLHLTKGRLLLSKWGGAVCLLSFFLAAGFSIGITSIYDSSNQMLVELNSNALLSNRLSLGQQALHVYGISAFGQTISFVGNGLQYDGSSTIGNYNYVDCLYLQILLRYGWVTLLGYLSLMTLCVFHAWKQKDPYAILILLTLALRGLIDDLAFYLYFNPFLLLIGQALFCSASACRNSPNESPRKWKADDD